MDITPTPPTALGPLKDLADKRANLIKPQPSPLVTKHDRCYAPLNFSLDSIEQNRHQTSAHSFDHQLPPLTAAHSEFDLTGVEYRETSDTIKSALWDDYLIHHKNSYDLD